MGDRIYIVAGNYQQFAEYKKRKVGEALANDDAGLGMETAVYTYVSSPNVIRGVTNPRGVFIGTWRKREDILDVVLQLRMSHRQANPALDKLWRDLEAKATPRQFASVNVASAAQRLADAIDEEVLKQAMMKRTNLPQYITQSVMDQIMREAP